MDTETQIVEILAFHDVTQNFKDFGPWFDKLYSHLRGAGASLGDDIDYALRRLTPFQISSIHASMPK